MSMFFSSSFSLSRASPKRRYANPMIWLFLSFFISLRGYFPICGSRRCAFLLDVTVVLLAAFGGSFAAFAAGFLDGGHSNFNLLITSSGVWPSHSGAFSRVSAKSVSFHLSMGKW